MEVLHKNDGQINLDGKENYLALGTIEAYNKYCEYFGKDRVCPIYIEVDDGTRLRRALERECRQESHSTERCAEDILQTKMTFQRKI